jgi:hypothetical protein
MSVRLAFDLGLHVDMSPYVARGLMNAEEAEVRKITFWGSFVVDQYVTFATLLSGMSINLTRISLWGFYLGRPPCRISTHNPTVQRPVAQSSSTPWVPYGLPKSAADILSPLPRHLDTTELVPVQWVLLCEIMSELCYIL